MKKNLKLFFLAFLFFSFVLSTPAFASEARIEDVEVHFKGTPMINFVVRDAFTKDIEEAINSGIPTTFTYIIRLNRQKNLWFDETIGIWNFNHTVKYDSLKEEYVITLGEKNRTEKTKDFEEMKKLMISGEDINVSPLPALKPGTAYTFAIKAELDTVNLPSLLNYMLFFVHLWDFETDWYIYEFTP